MEDDRKRPPDGLEPANDNASKPGEEEGGEDIAPWQRASLECRPRAAAANRGHLRAEPGQHARRPRQAPASGEPARLSSFRPSHLWLLRRQVRHHHAEPLWLPQSSSARRVRQQPHHHPRQDRGACTLRPQGPAGILGSCGRGDSRLCRGQAPFPPSSRIRQRAPRHGRALHLCAEIRGSGARSPGRIAPMAAGAPTSPAR
jgi:hypothetical protein